jgi:hypothetical protein
VNVESAEPSVNGQSSHQTSHSPGLLVSVMRIQGADIEEFFFRSFALLVKLIRRTRSTTPVSLKPSTIAPLNELRRGLVLDAIVRIQNLTRCWCLSLHILGGTVFGAVVRAYGCQDRVQDEAIEIDDPSTHMAVACWPCRRPPGLSSPLIGRLADGPIPAKEKFGPDSDGLVGWS